MSEEIHVKEHSSPIKTPKQLAIVVFLAFVVPITVISMIAYLATTTLRKSVEAGAMSDEAIAKRLKPVGEVVVQKGGAVEGGEKSGKEVVEQVCAACHASGALGAPKIGDKSAWAPRIKQGFEPLTKAAIQGIGQMPPKGGNQNLSDTEIARAVAYMANQAGADFKPPEAKAAAAAPAPGPAPSVVKPEAAAKAPAAPAAAAGKGKEVFEKVCSACHATGVAGAPKAGDKAAWAPRIKSGVESLYQSALHGKGAMPPKGGNPSLSESDIKAAVDYMVSLAR